MTRQIADLHFNGGGSDKVYHLLQNGSDLHVAYGRHGSGLAISKQTLASETKAASEFQKKFNEKLAKGYQIATGISGNIWGSIAVPTEDASVAPVVIATDKRKKAMEKIPSGFLPQLLNEISEAEAQRYIEDDAWGAQEKKNGRRHTVIVEPGHNSPRGANKLGFVIPTFVGFNEHVQSIQLDGEAIGGKLYAFDLLYFNNHSFKDLPYHARYRELLLVCHKYFWNSVEVIPMSTTTEAKQELWNRVKAAGGEGVVFKRLHASYTPGRPNRLGDQLKVVFWQHTQAVVTGITDGKRSVALACYDLTNMTWVDVGNVTIPANYDIPNIGDYVEIRYKYYYEGGSLFQPQYEGTTDVATHIDTDYMKLLRFPGED